MTTLEINYQKRKNKELFKELESHEILSMYNLQNYTPIYKNFFTLNLQNKKKVDLFFKQVDLCQSIPVNNLMVFKFDDVCSPAKYVHSIHPVIVFTLPGIACKVRYKL